MDDSDETRAQSQEALLEDSLAATLDVLRDMPESAKVRDLRGRAEAYRRALGNWNAVKPTAAQREALRDLILELHSRATSLQTTEAPTPHQGVPSVRSPPKR